MSGGSRGIIAKKTGERCQERIAKSLVHNKLKLRRNTRKDVSKRKKDPEQHQYSTLK